MALLPVELVPKQMPRHATVLGRTHTHIYLAVPSPKTAERIDIYDIVKPERVFAAIAPRSDDATANTMSSSSFAQGKQWGSVMAIRLFQRQDNAEHVNGLSTEGTLTLHMLAAYENGSLTLFRECTKTGQTKRQMETVWAIQCHHEPVQGMDISSDGEYAITCGFDSLLVKYHLFSNLQGVPETTQVRLKTRGIADAAFRDDNRIYHRENIYCVGFAKVKALPETGMRDAQDGPSPMESKPRVSLSNHQELLNNPDDGSESQSESESENESESESESDSDDDDDFEESLRARMAWSRRHWLAAGGKENRVSLWEIY
ncbi:ASTRA complex subunit [Podila epigama]|nr:ASTRA complex subunit [Podila epigama]